MLVWENYSLNYIAISVWPAEDNKGGRELYEHFGKLEMDATVHSPCYLAETKYIPEGIDTSIASFTENLDHCIG